MKIQFERSCRSQHNKFSQQSIKIYFLTEEDKNFFYSCMYTFVCTISQKFIVETVAE